MDRATSNRGKIIGYPAANKKVLRKKSFNPPKNKLPLIVLILLLGYVTFSFGSKFNNLYAMQQDVLQIQQQVDKLEQRNARLREELEMVQSDAYVEKVAREKLGLVKSGEVRVVPVEKPHLRGTSIRD